VSVVVSLLRAIDRADGEALVMHVGEKPYVVTAQGPAEIAAKALSIHAMTGMLEQLLPAESRQALNEVGAVEYHLPNDEAFPGMRYSVVAARGGDDIWIEIRRRKEIDLSAVALAKAEEPVLVEEPVAVGVSASESSTLDRLGHDSHEFTAPLLPEEPAAELDLQVVEPVEEPAEEVETGEWTAVEFDEPALGSPDLPVAPAIEEPVAPALEWPAPEPLAWSDPLVPAEPPPVIEEPAPIEEPADAFALRSPSAEELEQRAAAIDEDDDTTDVGPDVASGPVFDFSEQESEPEPAPAVAVVVPMARANVRLESVPRQAHVDPLQHLLQVGATHGASALYVAAQAKPSLRVDGEIHVLDEQPLSEAELESGLRALLGARAHTDTFPVGDIEPFDVPSVGRVQYFGFRDHRGLGGVFKMLPARAVSAQHVGLASPIQALCTEPEGLILVAGAHAAGKSTLVAALTDQINRTRRDHVITVENQIQFVHENHSAFVSQREARDERHFVEAVRTAIKEAPDVLVVDHVMNADVAHATLEAAVNGHMVVAAVTASSTAAALERFVEFFGNDRAEARRTLAEHLRGVIMQTLLRKTGGGRAAAREVLVNVPAVGTLIADGQLGQLGSVMNGGRRIGMVPLNDALLALVQNGSLDVRQAYRKSPDQPEFVTMLNKAGMDTSFAELAS
jgi:twitching motility protein PilT